MRKKVFVTIFPLLIVTLSLFPVLVNAHNDDSSENENEILETQDDRLTKTQRVSESDLQEKREDLEQLKQERLEKLDELKTERVTERCTSVTERVHTLLNNYGTLHLKQSTRYVAIQENLERAGQRLADLGIDTTELQLKLQELNSLVLEYMSLQNQFENSLDNSTIVVCQNDEAEFRNVVAESKQIMNKMKLKAMEILVFWKDEIKPLFAQYKIEAQNLRPISSPE